MKCESFYGGVIEMQLTECGKLPDGDKVTAATDGAGPQVIIGGNGGKRHLLSRMLSSHEEAEMVGFFIVASGTPDIYEDWCDLRTASMGAQLLRVFAGL